MSETSDYDRVMKQLNLLTTGGSNITWIREAIALIEAQRVLADEAADIFTMASGTPGTRYVVYLDAERVRQWLDRYREASQR